MITSVLIFDVFKKVNEWKEEKEDQLRLFFIIDSHISFLHRSFNFHAFNYLGDFS